MSEIDRAIVVARQHVTSDEMGYLPLGMRNAIWAAVARRHPDDWQFRRVMLGFYIAQESLARWTSFACMIGQESTLREFLDLPQKILARCQAVLREDVPISEGRETHSHFESLCYEFYYKYNHLAQDKGWPADPSAAIDICLATLGSAAWPDFDWGDEEAFDGDYPNEEPSFLACMEFSWSSDTVDRELCCQYWLHWLENLLPKALQDREVLMQDLKKDG